MESMFCGRETSARGLGAASSSLSSGLNGLRVWNRVEGLAVAGLDVEARLDVEALRVAS